MSGDSVRLVAGREFREGVRSKAYWVTTLIALIGVLGVVIIPRLAAERSQRYDLGVVGELNPATEAGAAQLAHRIGANLTARPLADRDTAVSELRAGRLTAAVVDGRDVLVRRAFSPGDTSTTARMTTTLSVLLALNGGPLPVTGVEAPLHHAPGGDRVAGFAAVLLLFVFLQVYGNWIVASVTEEKTSRLVELLLASVRPVDLMTGKVIGIGALAAVQAGLIGAWAYLIALGTGSSVIRHLTGHIVVVAAPVFVAGYLLYGLWFAAAGATVARPEDARSAAVSVIPIMVLGYIATIGTLGTGQDTSLLRVLTFVPWTAPFAILMRAGIQTLTGWQAALAGAEIVLAIAISASLAARIYRNSILRTGKRTPILAAIRA